MARYIGGVAITGYISPTDTIDIYATHRADLGNGGYRSVPDISTRDNITIPRREIGMLVYVIEEDKEYRLVDGITNSHWVEQIAPTPTQPDCECPKANYIIVDTLADIESYPLVDRFPGLILYAKDTDREFRLVDGIENVNLKEINSTLINYNPITEIIVDPNTGNEVQVPIDQTNNSTIVNVDGTNIEITNIFFNKIGCLNKAKIKDIILNYNNPSIQNYYLPGTSTPVLSSSDANIFTFSISVAQTWVDDWVLIDGTIPYTAGKISEVILEVTSNGISKIYNISEILKGNEPEPIDLKLFGNNFKWKGYFKGGSVGTTTIKAYNYLDGIKQSMISKNISFFSPNFIILDNNSPIPSNIKITDLGIDKSYEIRMDQNTNLNISLGKIQSNSLGIDLTNVNIIPETMQFFTADGTYKLNKTLLETLIEGSYALVVNGMDTGVTIPPYFYGPFSINKNNEVENTNLDKLINILNTKLFNLPITTNINKVSSINTSLLDNFILNASEEIVLQYIELINVATDPLYDEKILQILNTLILNDIDINNMEPFIDTIYNKLINGGN